MPSPLISTNKLQSALRIAPSSAHPTTTSTPAAASRNQSNQKSSQYPTAPSAPGLPDTLRAPTNTTSSHTAASTTSSSHPLETRLTAWRSTQKELQHSLLRRNFGLAEPLRRSYELNLVRDADAFRPSALGPSSSIHDDILSGRDAEMSWEDVYAGQDGLRMVEGQGMSEAKTGVDGGWHGEMEGFVRMGKW